MPALILTAGQLATDTGCTKHVMLELDEPRNRQGTIEPDPAATERVQSAGSMMAVPQATTANSATVMMWTAVHHRQIALRTNSSA